jgi:hypothetical protein
LQIRLSPSRLNIICGFSRITNTISCTSKFG